MSGGFTLDFVSPIYGQAFEVSATGTLTVHDDGLDETNYDMNGTVELSPQTFPDLVSGTCTVASAQKSIAEEYAFKLLKREVPLLRWSYAEEWDVSCTNTGPGKIIVLFKTGKGLACGALDDVPTPDPTHWNDTYTMTCTTPSVAASWNFTGAEP